MGNYLGFLHREKQLYVHDFENLFGDVSTVAGVEIGSTGYIDLVSTDEFDSCPFAHKVIKGVDKFNRNYISFYLKIDKYIENRNGYKSEAEYVHSRRVILTVFERYFNNKEFIVICQSHKCRDEHRVIECIIGTAGGTHLGISASNKLYQILKVVRETGLCEKRYVADACNEKNEIEKFVISFAQ